MKIYLIRHAEAAEFQGEDKERSLTSRGKDQAKKLSDYLKVESFNPDILFVSPSKRTLETSGIISERLNLNKEKIHFEEDLYLASHKQILELINKLKKGVDKIGIIGHNPGISDLTAYLAGTNLPPFPVATVASLEFELDQWPMVSANTGQLQTFFSPSK